MAKRLWKIVTRGGDQGTTGLGDGSRVGKDHSRIETLGCIDELNSALGVVLATMPAEKLIEAALVDVQQVLFELGAELCQPGKIRLQEKHVLALDQLHEKLNQQLPSLQEFILPGGSVASAHCHMARCICRRGERRLVALQRDDDVNPRSLQYLNRLSDVLFEVARVLARQEGLERCWKPEDSEQ